MRADGTGRLDGKVAFITGAARGQGRSHALALAAEGADIIAVDIAHQIDSIYYPMGTAEDLEETATLVRALDRRICAYEADVRDQQQLRAAFDDGVARLGSVDIVLANAGIAHTGCPEPDPVQTFRDVIETNLIGTWNSVFIAAPGMIERGQGGSIVLTSSTQGLSARGADGTAGITGYTAAKHGVVGLMRSFANWLSPHNIRVNAVNPTGVRTPMAENKIIDRWITENPHALAMGSNLMPVGLVEAADISNAILFLVTDTGRYITGICLPVDAGFGVK